MTSLVPYASSDEDEEALHVGNNKNESRPKKRLAAFNPAEEDDNEAKKLVKVYTSLGTTATKPLKGDWLCYAFVPISQDGAIYNIMQEALKILASRFEAVQSVSNPHISLTKPILVRHHEKDQVLTKTKEATSEFGREKSPSRFPIAFSAFTNLPSEDGSRIFWAVEIGLGWQELQSLTDKLNDKLTALHARHYYKEARFHSSFAWMPSNLTTKEEVDQMSLDLDLILGNNLRSIPSLMVNQIGVATGSQTHLIDLRDGASSRLQ